MKKDNINIYLIIILVLSLMLNFSLITKKKPEVVIPQKEIVRILVPGKDSIIIKRDTVKIKYPVVTEIKEEVLDTLEIDEFLQERKYIENYTDNNLSIDVTSNVYGYLANQEITYSIFPKEIETEVENKIIVKTITQPGLFLGATGESKGNLTFDVSFLNKSNKQIFTIGYNTDKNLVAGIKVKLF